MLFLLTKALNLMSLNSTPDFLLLKLHGSIYLNINFECSKVSSAFHRRTGRMPVDTLTRRRKSQWIGYTLRQNNNCIAGYAMQWNPLSHTRETEEWPALELRDTEQYRKRNLHFHIRRKIGKQRGKNTDIKQEGLIFENYPAR